MNLTPEKVDLVHKHYKRQINNGIYLDTGVLFLMLIGEYDRVFGTDFLKEFNYKLSDFEILLTFIRGVTSNLVITPHILTEFLSKVQKLNQKDKILEFISPFLSNFIEQNVSKDQIFACNFLNDFDIGEHSLYLCHTQKKPCFIITDERKFHGKLRRDKDILVCHFSETLKPAFLSQ